MKKIAFILLATLPLVGQQRPREAKKGIDRPPIQTEKPKGQPATAGVSNSGQSGIRGQAQSGRNSAYRQYVVVLSQPSVATSLKSRAAVLGDEGRQKRQAAIAAQAPVRQAVANLGIREIGSVHVLLNALFVEAKPADLPALRAISGVSYVREGRRYKPTMTKANQVIKSVGAWSQVGGQAGAGAGVKIAIIDSGIDHTHPAFEAGGLTMPAGFPKCNGDECNYTNAKVIAARSYVEWLVYYYTDDTRPDDISPRDRTGHGTAAAMAAAGNIVNSPLGQMSGVAPGAYLGNYKVFGSPGVNDYAFDRAIIYALEDAWADGMDIASLSIGSPALWSLDDYGGICGETPGIACDPLAETVEAAAQAGMAVVVSAGNESEAGLEIPTLNSVTSPGNASSAITVGASVNAHILYQSVRVQGGPSNLQQIKAYFGTGARPASPQTAPGIDASAIADGGACGALPDNSLTGKIALVTRGNCTFVTKSINAQKAGAVGLIVYQTASNDIFEPGGLSSSPIPVALIGNEDANALISYLRSTPDAPVTLDPTVFAVDAPADQVAIFSSQGPSIGRFDIKPELVSVGTDVYLATQNYDPNGEMYDASRYTMSSGTSFSTPMVAGAAALVYQKQPTLSVEGLKSALVNTANPAITDFDYDGVPVTAFESGVGAGQLDVNQAVQANVLAVPSTISFGRVTSLPSQGTLILANVSSAALTLQIGISERVAASSAHITVTPSQVTVPAGQQANIVVRLEGTVPTAANWYEGAITVQGGSVPLRIPYAFFVGDNQVFNGFALEGDGFTALGNWQRTLSVKYIDKQGVPVVNLPVQFNVEVGGGSISVGTANTDELGIAAAQAVVGTAIGEQVFSATAGGKTVEFVGRVIQAPAISSNGVVNAASNQLGSGIAPGSYISIYGSALSESSATYGTPYLPLALTNVSVGFNVPGQELSYPGRLHFISPTQVNVQVPWELAGRNTVDIKVAIGDISTALFRVAVNNYSPAAFEYTDGASQQLLAAALDENNAVVTAANGVQRGRVVQIYANGLGPVSNQPASGEPASLTQLSNCTAIPQVTIGGVNAPVSFCGLAPTYVGLYQLNVTVPQEVPAGVQPLVLTTGGVTSKTSQLPVR